MKSIYKHHRLEFCLLYPGFQFYVIVLLTVFCFWRVHKFASTERSTCELRTKIRFCFQSFRSVTRIRTNRIQKHSQTSCPRRKSTQLHKHETRKFTNREKENRPWNCKARVRFNFPWDREVCFAKPFCQYGKLTRPSCSWYQSLPSLYVQGHTYLSGKGSLIRFPIGVYCLLHFLCVSSGGTGFMTIQFFPDKSYIFLIYKVR